MMNASAATADDDEAGSAEVEEEGMGAKPLLPGAGLPLTARRLPSAAATDVGSGNARMGISEKTVLEEVLLPSLVDLGFDLERAREERDFGAASGSRAIGAALEDRQGH